MTNLLAMLKNHPFWGLMTIAVLAWYSTITVYVTIKGAANIKDMLRRLEANHEKDQNDGTG